MITNAERFIDAFETSNSIDVDGAFIPYYSSDSLFTIEPVDHEDDANDDLVVYSVSCEDTSTNMDLTLSDVKLATVSECGTAWVVGGHTITFFTVTAVTP